MKSLERLRGPLAPALALAGLLLLSAIFLVQGQPVQFGEAARVRDGEPIGLLVARGPAGGEYDAANDTTLVVFACGHGSCDVAVRVPGDVRSRLDAGSFLLRPVDPDSPFGAEPLGRRVDARAGLTAPGQEPDSVTVGHYDLDSPWPRAAGTAVGLLLVAAGGTLSLTQPGSEMREWLLFMSAMGITFGLLLGRGGILLDLLRIFVLVPTAGLGALLALRRRTRHIGLGLFALALLTLLTATLLRPLFPAGPEL